MEPSSDDERATPAAAKTLESSDANSIDGDCDKSLTKVPAEGGKKPQPTPMTEPPHVEKCRLQ